MRALFSPLAALLFGVVIASPLLAQQPVSPAEYYSRANPPPPDPRIVGLESRLAVLEEKVASSDAKLDAILAAVRAKVEPAKPAPVAVALPLPKVIPVAAVRAPLSHTHTCSQGHSWDHVANPTHNCPVCGEYVNRVDQPPRMVNVNVGAVTASPVVATVSEVSGSYYSLTASGGGCANGQCAAPSSGFARRGLFGWRR